MTRALTPMLLSSLLACQAKAPPPTREHTPNVEVAPSERNVDGQRVAAAGYELMLPKSWTIAADHDPNFALAQGPGSDPPLCTIELRRQGTGAHALPKLQRLEVEGRDDYRRGRTRGRIQRLPSSSPDATVVVHCTSPRGLAWTDIEAAFDSLLPDRTFTPLATPGNDGPIVELCTGTPVRQTYACVRTRSGEVHCGLAEGEALVRIAGIAPSQQISCDGIRACSRAADGVVSCWRIDETPAPLPELAGARDLAGACIVDAQGKVSCRVRSPEGLSTEDFAELVPLDDPTLALRNVEQVMAGSDAAHGCVLIGGALQCWDRSDELGLALPDHTRVHMLPTPADARELARIGERPCVAGPTQWTCYEGDRQFVLDGCEQHACGCSLTGAMAFSCEHEPLGRSDARLFGRVEDIVLNDGACAVRRDGTLLCRGNATGRSEDTAKIRALVVGGRPSVVHELSLSATNP